MKKREQSLFKEMKKNYQGYIFMVPLVAGILLLNIVPMVQSLIYSFMDYDMMNKMEWVGFGNYKTMFTIDFKPVLASLNATFLYCIISIPLNMVLSYFLALLLNAKLKGIGIFRTLIYLPCVIPPIASALLWQDMFDPQFGILNRILEIFQLPKSMWLDSPDSALGTMILMNLWGLGGGMILWLASFKNIPPSLYEAAKIDGASYIVQLFYITVPMTTPIIFYNLLNSMIGGLQVFTSFLMTTSSTLYDNIYFFAVRIYNEAFVSFNMGYASALAWILFLIIALLSLAMFKWNRWVFFGDEN